MVKLGVVEPGGLRHARTVFGTRRHVSALLLERLAAAGQVDEAAYDGVVEQLRMPNGTWKFTCRGRCAELDGMVLDLLAERVPRGSLVSVMDLAASTGVTSVELHRRLRERYEVDFVASDLYRDLYAVRSGAWTGVYTAGGEVVQHVVGRFVLPGQLTESWAYPVNRVLRAGCRLVYDERARRALAGVALDRLAPFASVAAGGGCTITRLPMLSGECLAQLRLGEGFRFEVQDITQPLPGRATVVRAMNILTREHFDDATRAMILRNLMAATLPGGLLVLGWSPWNDPGRVEASVYEVMFDGIARLASQHGGSEIDRFVESIVPVRDRRAAGVAV